MREPPARRERPLRERDAGEARKQGRVRRLGVEPEVGATKPAPGADRPVHTNRRFPRLRAHLLQLVARRHAPHPARDRVRLVGKPAGLREPRGGEKPSEVGEARPRGVETGIEPGEVGQRAERAVDLGAVGAHVHDDALGVVDAAVDTDPSRGRERIGGEPLGEAPRRKIRERGPVDTTGQRRPVERRGDADAPLHGGGDAAHGRFDAVEIVAVRRDAHATLHVERFGGNAMKPRERGERR